MIDHSMERFCQNIVCKKPLTLYELDRQSTRVFKYRFCRRCRQMPSNSTKSLVWKCRLCTKLLDTRTSTRGKFYCVICAERESIRRSKLRSKRYYIAKRGSRAV
jgi:hypothetical protein